MQCKTFFWLVSLVINLVPRALFPGFGAQELKRPWDAVDPIPDQNRQSLYPFSDKNGAKTLPDGEAHTYMAYIREDPPAAKNCFTPFLHNLSLR